MKKVVLLSIALATGYAGFWLIAQVLVYWLTPDQYPVNGWLRNL